MIYYNIFNPSHKNFEFCLDYILRSDSTIAPSRRISNFHGSNDDLGSVRDIASAIAPLAMEFGTPHARPRTRPWRHSILSLAPDEDIADKIMLDIAEEATAKLGSTGGKLPVVPTVISVHRDTDNLHAHILSVPVDLNTSQRIRAPHSVAACRSVLQPIETRLGLSSPKAIGRWDGKRFHLPFKTWVKMQPRRLQDVREALVSAHTWEECMRKLAVHGIKFKPTTANFSSSTRYYLAPFNSGPRSQGMAIQRDVFAGCKPAPSAAEIVRHWGAFPGDYQAQLEAKVPPGLGYTQQPIGGDRGRVLYRKWQGYAAHKRSQRENIVRLFDRALLEIRAKRESTLTLQERRLVDDPKKAKADVLDGAAPMKFADWVESMADRRDRYAQWLCRIAADGTNEDPLAALEAEQEGALDEKNGNSVDERELALRSVQKLEQERMARDRAKAKEREKRKRRKSPAVTETRPFIVMPSRRLLNRGAILETLR